MPKAKIRKIIYLIKYRYLTLNNAVIAVAFIIAASWAWGSVQVMQRNYALAQEITLKERQAELTELEAENLEYQNAYYQSAEYQELAVRARLGLAAPGEKVLVLPPNSDWATSTEESTAVTINREESSNFAQWLDFLFGGAKERLK